MDNQSLPVWACCRLSSGLISIVSNNKRVVGFLSKPLIDLKGQRSIPRSYFESLIDSDDYEYLTDPIDVAACKKMAGVTFFGYRLRARFLAVAGAIVGYQGSDAQKIVDVVYEARSHAFSFSES